MTAKYLHQDLSYISYCIMHVLKSYIFGREVALIAALVYPAIKLPCV